MLHGPELWSALWRTEVGGPARVWLRSEATHSHNELLKKTHPIVVSGPLRPAPAPLELPWRRRYAGGKLRAFPAPRLQGAGVHDASRLIALAAGLSCCRPDAFECVCCLDLCPSFSCRGWMLPPA